MRCSAAFPRQDRFGGTIEFVLIAGYHPRGLRHRDRLQCGVVHQHGVLPWRAMGLDHPALLAVRFGPWSRDHYAAVLDLLTFATIFLLSLTFDLNSLTINFAVNGLPSKFKMETN